MSEEKLGTYCHNCDNWHPGPCPGREAEPAQSEPPHMCVGCDHLLHLPNQCLHCECIASTARPREGVSGISAEQFENSALWPDEPLPKSEEEYWYKFAEAYAALKTKELLSRSGEVAQGLRNRIKELREERERLTAKSEGK